ncbi:DUF917 domain-containing protein [Candidatus Poriferisodalis sp.]|uniref:DUF917 domain-containing protein n=1 Tax=Candidatus Poriferisodalis sp. TaxID=3101277 RepID=UPI003B01AD53
MRELTLDDIDDLALGATLLGTGGGGDPYVGKLLVSQAIADHGPARVVSADELPDDGLVLTTAIIGAPTVILEKIPAGTEFRSGIQALAAYLGEDPVALMPIEVGGVNTLVPIATAVEMGLPVVDADGMRRAFPQIEMTVFTLHDLPAGPLSIADEKGNMCVFEANTNQIAESLARAAVIQLGLADAISCYPMKVADVRRAGIAGSMSYCTEVGKRLAQVKRGAEGAWDELLDYTDAAHVFSGKVIDIDRRTTEGFARGTVVLEHLDDLGRTMRVEIQNENLVAFEDGDAVVTVPDLLCLLDYESADPITTEGLAYGQRLNVLAMPCAPEWHRDGMLDLVGPRAFGYDIDYVDFRERTRCGG